MFSSLRFCNTLVNSRSAINQLFLRNSRNYVNLLKNNSKTYYCLNCSKSSNIIPKSRFTTNIVRGNVQKPPQNKGQKTVGYWLLTCSGMVFVAVVLGSVFWYNAIYITICKILEEVVKSTSR